MTTSYETQLRDCLRDFLAMAENEIQRVRTGKAPGPSMRDVLGQWQSTCREARNLLNRAQTETTEVNEDRLGYSLEPAEEPGEIKLEGMTQERWGRLPEHQRAKLRDLSGLTPQLIGLEGQRVEVVTKDGVTKRFIVGRSSGWRPCHIEREYRTSRSGFGAESEYASVRRLKD